MKTCRPHFPSPLQVVLPSAAVAALLFTPLARATPFSATASAGPVGVECTNGDVVGGSGFTAASTGPVSCADETPLGGTASSTASASGNWISGDFSASAVAAAYPGAGGTGSSIDATGSDRFSVSGLISGSGTATFSLTGLSGTVSAGPASPLGGASAANLIMLEMIAGGGGPVISEACLNEGAYVSGCPGGGFGTGLGTPPSVTLTVSNGEQLQLNVYVESTAFANAYAGPESASAGIVVDPLYLKLTNGATFDSGITGFLSAPASVPEPGSTLLLMSGLSGLIWARGRRRSPMTAMRPG